MQTILREIEYDVRPARIDDLADRADRQHENADEDGDGISDESQSVERLQNAEEHDKPAESDRQHEEGIDERVLPDLHAQLAELIGTRSPHTRRARTKRA